MKSVFFCIQRQQTSKYKSLCEIRRTSFSFYIHLIKLVLCVYIILFSRNLFSCAQFRTGIATQQQQSKIAVHVNAPDITYILINMQNINSLRNSPRFSQFIPPQESL